MYTVVGDIFRKCDSLSNIGNAVLYECICCVSSIHPNPKLMEAATEVISRFLKSDSHNLKYMGIDALGRLIKISPEIAEQHQLAVIDCLEDPDDTLKRKTFELLYKMTKSSNVEVIVDRMIDYMISINDNHYKTEIASRCTVLAEQFAPSNHWFIQTMNKVFEHVGDLVNSKEAHNLMRLIAEGFGEDDDTANSQLRSSAVESYLRIIEEPKLPSVFLQVICWVLGEYGTTDGKYSVSYIGGKLCDVADAYSNDEIVKAYAVTALMKIYAFEILAGREVDVLPECQSFIEGLSASHSTDLQQRAYELQEVIGLDARAVENIMPADASCEDIEIDKSLSFLNNYIQQSLEKGAQPYIPENERTGMFNINNYGNPEPHEALSHSLRFEAYELPKPSVPTRVSSASFASSPELVPVPEPLYSREIHQATSMLSVSEAGPPEMRLRLDGIQKKWGKPTYSTPSTPVPSATVQKPVNGVTQVDGASTASSKAQESNYDSRRQRVEISPQKQKLAASLFGGLTKPDKRSSTGRKAAKASNHSSETVGAKTSTEPAAGKTTLPPPPDLLDLGEPTSTDSTPFVDPFKQLEGLLDSGQVISVTSFDAQGATKTPDIVGLYTQTPASPHNSGIPNALQTNRDDLNFCLGISNATTRLTDGKGPNRKDSLEKDALVRQMGVNPSSQNPNLFRDLLG